MSVYRNRYVCTISNTPGTSGALTISTAQSGFQTFQSGDNGLLFDVLIVDGTAWEVRTNCTYTHSGTSLSRGTLEASSTGSAISLTSLAVVTVTATAAASNAWFNASRSINPGGRLTLTTGVPITTSDVTGASTIYYTPCESDVIPLWDGNDWVPTQFTERSLALSGLTASRPYDVFGTLSGGALTLSALGWASSTVTITIASPGVVSWTAHGLQNGDRVQLQTTGALPTGLVVNTDYFVVNRATDTFQLSATSGGSAINTTGSQSGTHTAVSQTTRATALAWHHGRRVKSGTPADLYLGTFRTTGTNTTEDSEGGVTTQVGGKRFLFNAYNQVRRAIAVLELANFWSYTTNAWRGANNATGTANAVEFVAGLESVFVDAEVTGSLYMNANGGSSQAAMALGLNTRAAPSGPSGIARLDTVAGHMMLVGKVSRYAPIGYNQLNWIENGGGLTAGSVSFVGDNGATLISGVTCRVMM